MLTLQSQSFVTSVIDLGRCTTLVPIDMRPYGPQRDSERFGEEKYVLPQLVFEPRTVHPVA